MAAASEKGIVRQWGELDESWAAPCGVCCRLCEFYQSPHGLSCGGCHEERLCRMGETTCWFIECTREHGVEHCGLCRDFPCQRLFESHQVCAGETPQVAIFRIGDLALRARMGTRAWLEAKLAGTLPDVWDTRLRTGIPQKKERRRYRRNHGRWPVTVTFLPGRQVFGLCDVRTACINASPIGIGFYLPEGATEGFSALARTKRTMEVMGEFPTSHGSFPFSAEVIWHNLESVKPADGIRIGARLLTVRNGAVGQ